MKRREKKGSTTVGRSNIPNIMALANALEQDIQQRNLKPGDAYLSLADAARKLGVKYATANRALQLLEQRNIIERGQRRGAFVTALQRTPSPGLLRHLFMFAPFNYLRQEGIYADEVLIGIQSQLTSIDVQFNFLPAVDPNEYVERLLGKITSSKEASAIVITKVPYSVQLAVKASGLPAVVMGSLYPSIERMAWVDEDQRKIARLVCDYALAQGAQHVCVLAQNVILPGDDVMLKELSRLLGAAGFKADGWSICHPPENLDAIVKTVEQLVQDHRNKLCIYSGTALTTQGTEMAIANLKLAAHERPAVVANGLHRHLPGNGNNKFPYVSPTMSRTEIGAAIGHLLAAQVTDPKTAPGHITIPLELSAGA